MRKIFALMLFSVLAACEPAAVAGGPANESYVLALSWQPAFCETAQRKPECRAQTATSLDARQFSLHGLWPQPGTNVWCGSDRASIEADKDGRWRDIAIDRLDEPLWRRLQAAMPGTRSNLHRHEWIKHGTCMRGVDAAGYFDASLDLLDVVNGSGLAALFAQNPGRHLTGDAIRAAFEADFGQGTGNRIRISCEDDGNRRIISEITIGIKCKIPGNLDREAFRNLVMASPQTEPGCPGGLVDRAGDQ